MDEGTVRMQAQMYAYVSEIEAIKAEIMGMEALNQFRIGLGQGVAYVDTDFIEAAKRLEVKAEELRQNI
jgi:hypothetical protein